ncbi:arginine/lysine/ornithine decarboxylase [Evansella vedderi]|uniref:Arginine/lysine/ornithine decarboxylase n=1 Tax=Evansella vedderi TaxID=38282 RepID=A0ABU0A3D8_9BACI|nr:aminotransferase class I/II-fold pyridoxal phosphate-dependent enzyme [Evansella vedderi]MDQ0258006.1 arginine/lysine/ornithine decarboxylase [Evansella vedderi]
MDQRETPLFNKLQEHARKGTTSFHVPGHKNGTAFHINGENIYKSILKMDVTEITGMDDLHNPAGVIQKAQQLAAELYKTQSSHFLIGGTTVGNLAMIMSAFDKEDIILVQRNSHQSIFHAIELSGVKPIYIEPEVDTSTGFSLGVSHQSVQEAIERYPNAKGLVLTNPSYEGYGQGLREHVRIAHLADMLVLVDEAHGAHLLFQDERWPKSAIYAGADVVVQSTHKMLPSMTMTSILHVNSSRVDKTKLLRYLKMLQSSSPSYPLMASLDLARAYLATLVDTNYVRLTDQIFDMRNGFIEGAEWRQAPRIIGRFVQDPLKMAVMSKGSLTGFDLQGLLEAKEIYPELASANHVLLTLPLTDEQSYYENYKLKLKLVLNNTNLKNIDLIKDLDIGIKRNKDKISEPILTMNELDRLQKHYIPWEESVGKVAAETITPYPPGVPLILKGERICSNKLRKLKHLIKHNVYFQTGDEWKTLGISVVKEKEGE